MPKSGAILAGDAVSPIRIIEDFMGNTISNAKAGQVVKVVGFDKAPEINSDFYSSQDKKKLKNYNLN